MGNERFPGIEFPGLGLKLDVSNTAFKIFGFPVYWYGLIIAFGIFLGVTLAARRSKKFGIHPDTFMDIVLFTTPVAIISARLSYVIFKFNEYDSLFDVINVRKGGLMIYGGIIGLLLTAGFLAKRKNVKLLNLFDLAAPFIALGQAIGRWGNFFNQEAFGSNTSLPWGMTGGSIYNDLVNYQNTGVNVNPDLPVHPTFLYESIWNLAAFFVLLWFSKKNKIMGRTFFLYMALYGLGRIWIEGLRLDSLMLGPLKASQVIALSFIVVFTALFIRATKKNKVNDVEEDESYYDILKNEDKKVSE